MTQSSSESTALLRLRGPQDVLAAIPHLLGFQPRACLVALLLTGTRSRVRLTMRLDLVSTSDALASWVIAVTERIHAARAETGAREVILVGYSDDAEVAESLRTLAQDIDSRADVVVREVLQVSSGRWRSVTCTDTSCCPSEGRPLTDTADSRVHAEWVVRGSAPAAGREAVVDRYRHDSQSARAGRYREILEARADVTPQAIAHVRERREVIAQIGRALMDDPCGPEDDDVWLAVARGLADIRVRDVMLRRLVVHSREHADQVREIEERLREAAIALPPLWSPGLAGLVAALAWLRGDGVAARAASDLALAADPDYSLAHLLHRVMDSGLSPDRWTRAILTTSEDACLHGVAA